MRVDEHHRVFHAIGVPGAYVGNSFGLCPATVYCLLIRFLFVTSLLILEILAPTIYIESLTAADIDQGATTSALRLLLSFL